jgi:hypothetical protein
MVKGTKVEISEALVEEAYALGKERHLLCRRNGVHDNQQSGGSWYQVDGEGVCGEMAFATLVDADEEEWDRIRKQTIQSAVGGTDTGDCKYKGYNFDVKTTKYATGHLILTQSKLDNLADAYALMVGFRGVYIFAGAISRERILRDMDQFDTRSNGSVWIHQDHLQSIDHI